MGKVILGRLKKKGNQRDISTAIITSMTATITVYWTTTVFYIQSRYLMYIALSEHYT